MALNPTRRGFLGLASAACGGLILSQNGQGETHRPNVPIQASSYLEILRIPDSITAFAGLDNIMPCARAVSDWSYKDISIQTDLIPKDRTAELRIQIASQHIHLSHLHLRWRCQVSSDLRCLGDHWERSYGDLEWRCLIANRVMPWYFLTFDGREFHGYGVKTGPAAFCFWQLDPQGVSLWIDVRNGGNPVQLDNRVLEVATVVSRRGRPDELAFTAAQEFAREMCAHPRLPQGPLLGSNDWNYAYGKNTEAGILRDADLIASIAPAGKHRPFVVIDDGWQHRDRFPDMAALADKIQQRNLRPGLWIRPARASREANPSLLLPDIRFKNASNPSAIAYDPTIPEALEHILDSIRDPIGWGYKFIKHDFSTYDLLGQWGWEMGASPTVSGWKFSDPTRTTAEILTNLYRSLREAAGDRVHLLGCNTIGHLAAGIFDSQRIGDDTSGTLWERTRRMGVNALAFRIAQHRTFFSVDPDCVAITRKIDWNYTKQWLDVVASSGTALFISPQQEAVGPDQKAALREAFSIAGSSYGFAEDWLDNTTPQQWLFRSRGTVRRFYNWYGQEGATPFSA